MIQSHGGDLRLLRIEDGAAQIALTGACAGCPPADGNTRAFVANTLKAEIPAVRTVHPDQARGSPSPRS